ncbi:hypothetical protein BV898_18188 [Hypsibius exemplaris]|uniref:Uncharacterized protein n=1 Tax=Hypsibius exemplaris TaxID=2072580 RepID=A0A9X6RNL3_HYPEX|nr:hypothetical protein BV898_18188 [Hypsibius exemplaris]
MVGHNFTLLLLTGVLMVPVISGNKSDYDRKKATTPSWSTTGEHLHTDEGLEIEQTSSELSSSRTSGTTLNNKSSVTDVGTITRLTTRQRYRDIGEDAERYRKDPMYKDLPWPAMSSDLKPRKMVSTTLQNDTENTTSIPIGENVQIHEQEGHHLAGNSTASTPLASSNTDPTVATTQLTSRQGYRGIAEDAERYRKDHMYTDLP